MVATGKGNGLTSKRLDDTDWELLLNRIKEGKCTPFLGAGACDGVLPLGSDIAREWAKKYAYPLTDTHDLARVAQFLAVTIDPMFPKEQIRKRFAGLGPPEFDEGGEPHGILAELPLPVYITTNYDDFMIRALQNKGKVPRRELCRWNSKLRNQESVFSTDYSPNDTNPVVFHLHGHTEVDESLVLTQDDYLDFLVNVSRDGTLLPPRIQRSMTGSSLLFIGYGMEDWSFRVLFRGLVSSTEASLRRVSLTVQLPRAGDSAASAQAYLSQYFGKMDVRVYWGTARGFLAELHERWRKFLSDT